VARIVSGLRLQRLARGLTLRELSERIDLSEATLSRLERGLIQVREDVAKKLDRIYGVVSERSSR
jgi:transcriptional regulator with XRE-family HTH domain